MRMLSMVDNTGRARLFARNLNIAFPDFENLVTSYARFASVDLVAARVDIYIVALLWNLYGKDALAMPLLYGFLLKVAHSCRKFTWARKGVDTIRAYWLHKLESDPNKAWIEPSTVRVATLERYLSASGNRESERAAVLRVGSWMRNRPDEQFAYQFLFQRLAKTFIETALEVYPEDYTIASRRWLAAKNNLYRQDYMESRRHPAEHVLNLITAAWFDELGRNDFIHAKDKLVFVPACSRKPENTCGMVGGKWGNQCTNCSALCPVGQLNQEVQKRGAHVWIHQHASSLLNRGDRNNHKNLGVLGVACTDQLLSGGLRVRDANIPVRCSMLTYPHCETWGQHCQKSVSLPVQDILARLDGII